MNRLYICHFSRFFLRIFCWLLLNPLLLTPRNIVFYAHSPFISHSRILPSPPHSSFTFFSLYFHSSSFTIQLCEAPAYLFGTIETKNVTVEFVIGLCKKTKHEHEKYRHTQTHTHVHTRTQTIEEKKLYSFPSSKLRRDNAFSDNALHVKSANVFS